MRFDDRSAGPGERLVEPGVLRLHLGELLHLDVTLLVFFRKLVFLKVVLQALHLLKYAIFFKYFLEGKGDIFIFELSWEQRTRFEIMIKERQNLYALT